MARFLIDENLPRSTADALRAEGHEATHVREVGLGGQDDPNIFAYAQAAEAVLITADKGFGSILSFPPGTHAGIIVLSGALVILDRRGTRIRRTGIETC